MHGGHGAWCFLMAPPPISGPKVCTPWGLEILGAAKIAGSGSPFGGSLVHVIAALPETMVLSTAELIVALIHKAHAELNRKF